jgi:uncharacterized protein (TIGR03083 family)
MKGPAYAELVTAVRREGEGILTAAGLGLDAEIPALDWNVEALLRHVGDVYTFATRVVSSRATERPERPGLPDGDPLEVVGHALDELIAALKDCDAETPVWNWAPDQPDLAGFWARRMAHESSVHRYDAQTAHGMVQPIDAELAGDGIDELIDIVAPRVYRRDEVTGPAGTIALDSSDDGTWCIELEPGGLHRLDVLSEPAVTVHGTTSALLLASYTRVPWTALETEGDTDLLAAWSAALNF